MSFNDIKTRIVLLLLYYTHPINNDGNHASHGAGLSIKCIIIPNASGWVYYIIITAKISKMIIMRYHKSPVRFSRVLIKIFATVKLRNALGYTNLLTSVYPRATDLYHLVLCC